MKYIKSNILYLGITEAQIKKNLDKLIRYIYNQLPLNHDQMKKYYKNVKVPVSFDDHDKSNDYDTDYYRSEVKFVNCKDKDNKYSYEFDNELCMSYYDDSPFIKTIHKYLTKRTPKKLKIGDFTSLHMFNECGINKDARGVRYLDWRLYFWPEYDIDKESVITLHDLIIAVYKIRSHKFENNYEMYCGIKYLNVDNDILCIGVDYDHGS